MAGTDGEQKKKKKQSSSQNGFMIAAIVLSLIVVPFMYYSFSLMWDATARKPDFEWPALTELWKAAVSGVFFIVAKKIIIKVTYNLNAPICKDQHDKELHDLRTKKASKYIFSFIYFTFATSYGYYTLKDTNFLPWYLGGSGSWDNMYIGMPYITVSPGVMTYAMLQLGYHFGDLLHLQFLEERQNDYFEMMSHHICAASLLIGMVYANFTTVGTVVAFQHDIADITASVCKYFSCTIYTKLTAYTFITNMVVWAYTRNILLPYILYRIWTEVVGTYPEPFKQYWPVPAGAALFLSMMLFLHYYWYYLFFMILTNYKKTGRNDDLQNVAEKKEQ